MRSMVEQAPKEEILRIIKEIDTDPAITQRELSVRLGISLGKTNYLLKELVKKGLIEIKNFSTNNGKLGKIQYLLTKEGLEHKVELMFHFLKAKEDEFNSLKQEYERLAIKIYEYE